MNPEERAEDLLRRHRIDDLPVPVDAIAAAEGATVVRRRFEGDTSGFMYAEADRTVIGINAATSRRRQRFTVAHEIGHMALHRDENKLRVDSVIQFRDPLSALGTDPQERDANAFAVALLMPAKVVADQVRAALKNNVTDRDVLISSLATTFDVSTEAMGYRLINLGVLRG